MLGEMCILIFTVKIVGVYLLKDDCGVIMVISICFLLIRQIEKRFRVIIPVQG